MRALPFLLSYLVPLSVLATAGTSGLVPGVPVLLVFVAIPLLDRWIGESRSNPAPNEEAELKESLPHRLVLWFYVPLHLAVLAYAAAQLRGISIESALIVLSVGVSSGAVGITVAHELIHRPGRFERGLGVIILASVLYGHFRIEHVVGHHAKVATPRDPATARRGQSVYRFWVQSVAGGLADAWTIESRRRKRLGRSVVSPANRLLRYAGVSGVLGGLLGLAFGPATAH